MATVHEGFSSLEDGLWELGDSFAPESWKGHHDEAMRRREFEARITAKLPMLRNLIAVHMDIFEAISAGHVLDSERVRDLRKAATMASHLVETVSRQVADLERAGEFIEDSREFQALLRSARSNLDEILEGPVANDPSPSKEAATPGPAPFDLPVPGERIPAVFRFGPPRLPDPPFETGEGPAPFDLPVPGEWKRVKARPGPARLPDPIGFED